MLSDADLASLGSIRKANPNHKDWQPMHLYLQAQVGVWRWQFGGDLIWLLHYIIKGPAPHWLASRLAGRGSGPKKAWGAGHDCREAGGCVRGESRPERQGTRRRLCLVERALGECFAMTHPVPRVPIIFYFPCCAAQAPRDERIATSESTAFGAQRAGQGEESGRALWIYVQTDPILSPSKLTDALATCARNLSQQSLELRPSILEASEDAEEI